MAFWKFFQKEPLNRTDSQEGKADFGVFDRPWRNINWNKSELEEKLREFTVCNQQIKHFRFLMKGPIGAGKSSFVNSIDSAFQNRVTNKAIASSSSNVSCTRIYRPYKIKDGNSGTLSFMFYDTMGVEDGKEDGIHLEDLKSALRGNLPDEYKFNPRGHLTPEDPHFNNKPSMEERTHCLICVVSANSISQISDEIFEKLNLNFRHATDIGIPQVVIMTMIDQVCPLVKKDLRNVYTSKKIKEKMMVCSDRLSIPMTCIFPVKNYYEEIETNNDMDVLLLSALKQILHFANDYTDKL
ncbi:interferon-induced protein 44-like isoform X1 [Silurus meridionalis]|uniref:Interferon-induced protein 44-like n=1 Tax=Silurus meridionalis TaxID=175797 RepID=A0A8T0AZF8_SILME|nr:interferon-induced protein 44-like isoform X1 [Silurus meridionalis]KAF7698356.1 hypothetical protein HF521_004866 [Silurus meridionalis]